MKIKEFIFQHARFTAYCLLPMLIIGASCTKSDGPFEEPNAQDTLSLRDFNVFGNGTDETEAIQDALNESVGKVLYIPEQEGSHYLTGQLIVPDSISIVCHPDVVFMAKDDLEQDLSNFEVMWRFEGSENVTFDGQRAIFKMDRSKYSSEFNHIFMINGSKNVTLKNINADSSAGDGFYVGAIRTERPYPENTKIENCIATNSTRQGLSVTSAENLEVINSEFNYSRGKSPMNGVDIEPFDANGVLRNIKFSNCKAVGNNGRGFAVILMRLIGTSASLDILFEDCTAINNSEGFSNRVMVGVQGTIEMRNCTAKDSRRTGITESSCMANSVKRIYQNCVVDNSNTAGLLTGGYLAKAAIYISASATRGPVFGNCEFIDCTVINDENSEYGLFVDQEGIPFEDITLTNLQVENSSIETVHNLP